MKSNEPISQECPKCQKVMRPVVCRCDSCNIEMRADFEQNTFAMLSSELQHFLHVFVHCEGKIGDMEKALGISYPTVKSKIAQLKTSLQTLGEQTRSHQINQFKNLSVLELLAKMESGELSYEIGLQLIKRKQKGN